MLRQLITAGAVASLCLGIALAEELRGVITKVDGDKVTFAERKGKGEKGEEKTYTTAAKVKVVKGKYNKETKKIEDLMPVEGGLKNELFTKIGDKGVQATIVTEDSKGVRTRDFINKAKLFHALYGREVQLV